MIEVNIPGRGTIQITHLVSDVNGTLALDGCLLEGVANRIELLKQHASIHLLTANTTGKQAEIDRQLGLTAKQLLPGKEAEQKADFIRSLGADHVMAIGQGANDRLMLQEAALGICVLSKEGTATETLLASDLVVPDILTALDLLAHPLRIMATLRR